MFPKLALSASTLALGTALIVVPALAQNSSPPNGSVQQNSGCTAYFQTSCSDRPYPMAQPDTGRSASTRGVNNGTQATEGRRSRTMERTQARNMAPRYGDNGQGRRYYDYAGPDFAGQMRSGALAACAARFRSYDPATGTYMGFDGDRHSCP